MAHMERDEDPQGPLVRGFAPGGFLVDGTLYSAVNLTPVEARQWDAPATVADLGEAHLDALLALDPPPEFLLLGTGSRHAPPPRAFREAVEARGVGLEVMDSRAAARTWGLLRGEERWIVAALMSL